MTVFNDNDNSNLIVGTQDSDVLLGNGGDDSLQGGKGSDSIMGGRGSDTVYFNKGDGIDTIDNSSDDTDTTTDVLIFGENIKFKDLVFVRDNNSSDLTVSIVASVDSIVVKNYFSHPEFYRNIELHFVDGMVKTFQELINVGFVHQGDNNDNSLAGFWGNDTLQGGGGNDTLIGGKGDDFYDIDGLGDIVIEEIDGGIDTIRASETYVLEDESNVENLILVNKNFSPEEFDMLPPEQQHFINDINGRGNNLDNYIEGNSGGNLLEGLDGNDTLVGGYYDVNLDTLKGGLGNDSLAGAGQLYGEDGDDILRSQYSIQGSILNGGIGNDTLVGSGTLIGGEGDDVITTSPDISEDLGNRIVVYNYGYDGRDDLYGHSGVIRIWNAPAYPNLSFGLKPQNADHLDYNLVIHIGLGSDELQREGIEVRDFAKRVAYPSGTTDIELNPQMSISIEVYSDDGSHSNPFRYYSSQDMFFSANPPYSNSEPVLTGIPVVLANGTEDQSYLIDVNQLLQGFSDVDGDILRVVNLTATNGALSDNQNDTYTFTPAANFNGKVTLSYEVSDGQGGVIAASNSFDVQPMNDVPVLMGAKMILKDGTRDQIYILSANDLLKGFSDIDDDQLSVTNLQVNNGRLVDNGDNTYTFIPNFNFKGEVHVTYDVIDGFGGSIRESNSFTLNAVFSPTEGNDTLYGTENPEDMSGLSGNDSLWGLLGNDTLSGGEGNDTLQGGQGDDKLFGGEGDDVYHVDTINDVVTESLSSGIDTVISTVSYVLADYVENLILDESPVLASGTYGGSLYQIVGDVSFIEGELLAISYDGHLASIHNQLENDFISQLLGKKQAYIGLTDNLKEGIYTWTDGTLVDFTYWNAGEPNDIWGENGEDYVHIWDETGVWNDAFQSSFLDSGTTSVPISYGVLKFSNNIGMTTSLLNINGTGNYLNNLMTGNSGDNILSGGAGNDTLIGGGEMTLRMAKKEMIV